MRGNHAKRVTHIGPDSVQIEFSPEVKQQFARLEALVTGSEHFGHETLETLRYLAQGNAFSATDTLASLMLIVQETHHHVHATGDNKASIALLNLMEALDTHEREAGYPPYTLVKSPSKGPER